MLFGATTGLATLFAVFLGLGVLGQASTSVGLVVLILMQYVAMLLAGYLAGRFARTDRALHGGVSAMLLLVIVVALGLARSDSGLSLVGAVFSALLAATIGTAGGVLAEWQRRESRDETG